MTDIDPALLLIRNRVLAQQAAADKAKKKKKSTPAPKLNEIIQLDEYMGGQA